MSGFPTFRLPFLAAKVVVNQLDLGDLTALFLCSKKTQKIIKSLHKSVSFVALSLEQKNSLNFLELIELFREEKLTGMFLKDYNIEVDIKISDDIGFKLNVRFDIQEYKCEYLSFRVYAEHIDQQDQYKGTKRNLKIGDVTVPVVMTHQDVIYTFWNSKQDGFKIIGEYLRSKSTLFDFDVTVGRKEEFSENLRFAINWMNSTKQTPSYLKLTEEREKLNEDDFRFILDNVHPTTEYDLCAVLSDKFQHNINFESEYLYLLYAHWFSLANLLKADCGKIRLENSKLTNEDLKEYFKQWMAGKFLKLRDLEVEMQEDMNIDMILADLEGSLECQISRCHNCVYVLRNDGCVAQISTQRSSKIFEMKTTNLRNHIVFL